MLGPIWAKTPTVLPAAAAAKRKCSQQVVTAAERVTLAVAGKAAADSTAVMTAAAGMAAVLAAATAAGAAAHRRMTTPTRRATAAIWSGTRRWIEQGSVKFFFLVELVSCSSKCEMFVIIMYESFKYEVNCAIKYMVDVDHGP